MVNPKQRSLPLLIFIVLLFLEPLALCQSAANTSVFPMEEIWSVNLGAPAARPTYDQTQIYVSTRDGQFLTLSLYSGKINWVVDHPTGFSPAVGTQTVFIAGSKTILALDKNSGTTNWKVSLDSEISAPIFWIDGLLLVALQNGNLAAIDDKNGHNIWITPLVARSTKTLSISDKLIYASLEDGRIVCLDLNSGEQIWEQTLPGSPGPILVSKDLFLGSTDNFFYRLSKKDGSVKWRWRTGADIIGTGVVDENTVYFLSLDNILRALDRKSGVQQWTRHLDMRPNSGPTRVRDTLLVSGVSPEIRSFRMRDGQPDSKYTAPGDLAAPPHVVEKPEPGDPELVILTGQGELVGLRRPAALIPGGL